VPPAGHWKDWSIILLNDGHNGLNPLSPYERINPEAKS
jgi:hypothetical protein